jgi:hypothetical protein
MLEPTPFSCYGGEKEISLVDLHHSYCWPSSSARGEGAGQEGR